MKENNGADEKKGNVENTDAHGRAVKAVGKEILKKRKLRKRRMLLLTQMKGWAILKS